MNATVTCQTLVVGADHPCLTGHFPGNPIVPGMMILDAVLAAARGQVGANRPLQRLPQIKFLRPLLPEQVVTIELNAVATSAHQQRLRFRILREGEVLSSGELLFSAAETAT